MYTRLNKLGNCVSHKTSNIIIRKLGESMIKRYEIGWHPVKLPSAPRKVLCPLQDGDQEQQLQDRGRQAGGGQGQ